MRRWSLEKYKDGNKHLFSGKIERFGSFIDRASGKKVDTVLITDLFNENNEALTDHVWVKQKKMDKYGLKTGQRYTFMARVGTYQRGRTAADFQLKNLTQFAVA